MSTLLDAAAITPANVVFEITEKLAIENFASFRRALAVYTSMGFGVAIDDVGTRHSNLETVMALRPNFIKVSDVLTRGVSRSTVKREMFRSLGNIASTIDAVVVAEGIETPDDLEALHDLGVHYAQGFLLARPSPPFVKLRARVRKALQSLTRGPREPIAALPADAEDELDAPDDLDNDVIASTDHPARENRTARDDDAARDDGPARESGVANGSGEQPVPPGVPLSEASEAPTQRVRPPKLPDLVTAEAAGNAVHSPSGRPVAHRDPVAAVKKLKN